LKLTFRAKPAGWGIRDEIAEIRNLVDIALIGMGWPRSKERIAVDQKGGWRSIASHDDLRAGEIFHWSFTWIDVAAKPLSEAHFLGRMAFEIACIEHAIESGDTLALFRHAARLGSVQTEIDVRRIALRFATVGQNQLAASKEGSAKRSAGSFKAIHGAEAQSRAGELHRGHPHWTWAKICKTIAAEYGVGTETVKKSLTNPKKDR